MIHNLADLLSHKSYKTMIINGGVFRFPSHYRFECHSHKAIEINYVSAGCCTMEVQGEYVPLKMGDCLIIYPQIPHSFMVNMKQSCRLTQLEFELDLPEGEYGLAFLEEIRKEVPYRKCCHCDTLASHMELLCQYGKTQDQGANEYQKTLMDLQFAEIYVFLSQMIAGAEQTGDESKFKKLLRHINENFTRELDMETLAAVYGISSRYVRKRFRQDIGMNSSQYITMLRVNKAKELLWKFSLSVTDVAFQTGFGSSQYFSRMFKSYTKMTPAEYRKLWSKTRNPS